ncbi:MAG: DUF4386 family protein [Pseudomonadota bacterium]
MAFDQRAAGRWVGGLMLLQLVAGAMTMLVLTAPLFTGDGYLAVAGTLQSRLGLSILLTLAGTVVAIAIAILMFTSLRSHGPALALGLLMLTAVGAALSAVEQGGILAMTQFSSAYLEAEAAARASFENLRAAGSLLRNGMHYVGLIMHGMTLACLYSLLWRSAALPRVLPALGLGAACLQMYAIAQPILGGVVDFALLAPLGLAQLLNGGWLLARGFRPAAA